jgi:hypothetical protein
MTLLNLISFRARESAAEALSDDHSIMLMVSLLLGLVFAPVIGLHIAAILTTPQAAAFTPDSLADHAAPPAKPARG